MNIYEAQFSCPTAFNNGISVGDFYVDSLMSSGVPAGLVQPYFVAPTPANSDFLTGTVEAGQTIYVPLSSFIEGTTGFTIVTGQNEQNPGLKLDCERSLAIDITEASNILISGYDRYGQPQTWGKNASSFFTEDTTRAFSKLSSIKITNTSGSTLTYKITTNYTLGLPYATFGGIIPLAVYAESSDSAFNLLLYQADAPGNPVTKFYTYYPVSTQTLNAGNPRPLIDVNPGSLNNYYDFDGSKIISAWQLVYGAGTLPHWLQSDAEAYALYINSLEAVIGEPPYKEGWIGWQG